MGFGLRDFAVNAGEVMQGADTYQRRAASDESARLDLENKRIATDETKRVADLAKGARGVMSQSYTDAKDAQGRANDAVRTQNEPQQVTQPGEDGSVRIGWKNPQTGQVFDDKAKAYGVVPEQSLDTVFEKQFAPSIRDYYMKAGAPDMAAKFDEFTRQQTGKRYLNEAHEANILLHSGNKLEALKRFQDLYNSQVRDGNYGVLEDLGNGRTRVTVHNTKSGQSNSQILTDEQLGQRAAMFLDPEYIAKNFLTTQAKTAQITAQFNADVAKERIKAVLHDNSKSQEIALQTRSKMIENLGHAQIDMLLGKGAKVDMDQLGQNIIVTVPGQGIFKLEKGELKPVKDGQFGLGNAPIRMWADDLMGSLLPAQAGVAAPQQTGVQQGSPAPAPQPAPSPAGATGKQPMLKARAVELLQKNPSAETVKFFEDTYGEKADQYLKKIPGASVAPAAAPAPAAPPAPAKPTRGVASMADREAEVSRMNDLGGNQQRVRERAEDVDQAKVRKGFDADVESAKDWKALQRKYADKLQFLTNAQKKKYRDTVAMLQSN